MSAEAGALSDGGMLSGIRRVGRRSDETLSAIAARGDSAAFEAVYERHHRALYRYCFSILGHHEDASDAVHNAMLKAWQGLLSGGPKAPLRPWLFRIAHNEAITVIRRRRTHAQLDEVPTAARSVEETLDTRLRFDRLRADLEAMPTRQRSALLLRELCGLRHDEIAAVLDVSAATARQTIYEARVALHEAEAGRELACEIVRRALSDGDGRVRRGRKIRTHLRTCSGCASFDQALRHRPGELAALTPLLPGATVAGLLARIGGAHTASGGVPSATTGAMAAGVAGAGSTISQVASVIATTVAVGTAVAGGVGGVIHLQRAATPPPQPATAAATAGMYTADLVGIEIRPELIPRAPRPLRTPAPGSGASPVREPEMRPVATRAPSPAAGPSAHVVHPAKSTAEAAPPTASSLPEPVGRQGQARPDAPAADAHTSRRPARAPEAPSPGPRPVKPRPTPGRSPSAARPSPGAAAAPAARPPGASSRPGDTPPAKVPPPAVARGTADGPPAPPPGARAAAGASAGQAPDAARASGASAPSARGQHTAQASAVPSVAPPQTSAAAGVSAMGPVGPGSDGGSASGPGAPPGPRSGA